MRFNTGKIGTHAPFFSNWLGIRIKQIWIKRDPPVCPCWVVTVFATQRGAVLRKICAQGLHTQEEHENPGSAQTCQREPVPPLVLFLLSGHYGRQVENITRGSSSACGWSGKKELEMINRNKKQCRDTVGDTSPSLGLENKVWPPVKKGEDNLCGEWKTWPPWRTWPLGNGYVDPPSTCRPICHFKPLKCDTPTGRSTTRRISHERPWGFSPTLGKFICSCNSAQRPSQT